MNKKLKLVSKKHRKKRKKEKQKTRKEVKQVQEQKRAVSKEEAKAGQTAPSDETQKAAGNEPVVS